MKFTLAKTVLALSLISLWGVAPASAQNTGLIKKSARTAAAGISVSNANGKSTVTYGGKEVWTGKATGKITGRSKVVSGVEYAAAFDGDKAIWENVPGAGAKVK